MTSRILKIILPIELITLDNLRTIQKITETKVIPVVSNNIVIVNFEFKMSLNKLNTIAIKISKEFDCELFSIFQNSRSCTINYI